jgi:hypothetical protein
MKGSKEISSKAGAFAKGGTNPMFSVRYPKSGAKDKADGGHMKSTTAAGPQKPGVVGHTTSSDGGKFGKGGNTKMFGYNPSVPATAGKTSAR